MGCFTELNYSMYVDQELPAEEARQVEAHLLACTRCSSLVGALREENRFLMTVLGESEVVAPPRTWRFAPVWVGLAGVAAAAVWGVVIEWLAKAPALNWLNPFTSSGQFNLAFELLYSLAFNAPALASMTHTVALWTIVLVAATGVMVLMRRPAKGSVGLIGLLLTFALSTPAFALETRKGFTVSVPSAETVEGALVATGDNVQVDGTINGDLIVWARTVEIRGKVSGDLIFGGERAEIRGTVDGNVYQFGRTLDVRGTVVRSIYGFNKFMTLDPEARVGADVNFFGQSLRSDGVVSRSVWFYGENARIEGSIGKNLITHGRQIDLLAPARVGGDFVAHVLRQNDVRIESGVTIGGATETQLVPPRTSRLARPKFYFWVVVNLLGTMLLGFVWLLLTPRFFHGSVQVVSRWRSLGLGFAVLVAAPIAMIIVAITLIGLPIALIALALYLLGLYAAKIIVGAYLGRTLLKTSSTSMRDSLLALLLGLIILLALFQIPYLGKAIHAAVFCFGLGALSSQLARRAQPREIPGS